MAQSATPDFQMDLGRGNRGPCLLSFLVPRRLSMRGKGVLIAWTVSRGFCFWLNAGRSPGRATVAKVKKRLEQFAARGTGFDLRNLMPQDTYIKKL
jgi:hypothetical protein